MVYFSLWETIKGFFLNLYEKFDAFLEDTLGLDQKLIDLYQEYITPIPEIIKILGLVFLGIIIVLGVLSFVKKMLKLFIVLAVILAIVLILTRLS